MSTEANVARPSGALPSSTRPVRPELAATLRGLRPGQRIRVTQAVRVGSSAKWAATVEGAFRDVNFLVTGLATDRVREDDIVVVCVHFTKDNGELTSVTLDENSRVEVVS
jgi:hypothetical protein